MHLAFQKPSASNYMDDPNVLANAMSVTEVSDELATFPTVTKAATLRVFPDNCTALGPYSCRLCETGWCTEEAFKNHIIAAHGPVLPAGTDECAWSVAEQFYRMVWHQRHSADYIAKFAKTTESL